MLYGKKIAYLLHINIQQLINMLRIELLWGGGGGVFSVTPIQKANPTLHFGNAPYPWVLPIIKIWAKV
jgi:hypothetical protein